MTYIALPTKSPGDVLTSALWNTYLQGNADSGFMRMIADSTLGSSQASINFASVPQTFAHLLLVVYAREDTAVTSDGFGIRFNGDTGANYDYQNIRGNAAAASASETFAATFGRVGTIPGASAGANLFAVAEIIIPHYTGTTNNKQAHSRSSAKIGTTSGSLFIEEDSVSWRSSAAISTVTIVPGSGNLVAGTRATLYGLPV